MLCLKNCPEGAIEEVMVDDIAFPQVVPELCIGCGTCEEVCLVPDGPAIKLYAPEDYPG
jgi:Fe-S-cluster-containing hydrogenase component 2